MSSDERILQVLDHSACLSKGQLLGYLNQTLYPEELRAVELHLSGCNFCSDALDGYENDKNAENIVNRMVMPSLPALPPREKEKPKEKKEPVPAGKPEAHPAAQAAPAVKEIKPSGYPKPRRNAGKILLRLTGIAAVLAMVFAGLWYFENGTGGEQLALTTGEDTSLDTAHGGKAEEPVSSAANISTTASSTDTVAAAVQAPATSDSLLLAAKLAKKERAKKDSAAYWAAAQRNSDTAPAKLAAVSEPASKQAEQAEAAVAKRAEVEKTADKAQDKEAEINPDQSDFDIGMNLYKQKQYASALMYFRPAESDKSHPKHWDAVYYSALCNKQLNKNRRARKQFERIVEAGAPQKKLAQKQLDEMQQKDDE
jgi:hypothetical protein